MRFDSVSPSEDDQLDQLLRSAPELSLGPGWQEAFRADLAERRNQSDPPTPSGTGSKAAPSDEVAWTSDRRGFERRLQAQGRLTWLAAAAAMIVVIGAALLTLAQPTMPDMLDATGSPESTPTTMLVARPAGLQLPASLEGGPELFGIYQTDAFGIPMQFEVDGGLRLMVHAPGEVRLDSPTDSTTQDLYIERISGFFTAAQSEAPILGEPGAIPPDDIDRWLAEGTFIAERDELTKVGGYPARVLDVRLDGSAPFTPNSCSKETLLTPCRFIFSKSLSVLDRYDQVFGQVVAVPFEFGEKVRFWVVDLPGAEPLVIAAARTEGNNFENLFFDDVDRIVDSIRFGPPTPLAVPSEREREVAEALTEDDARGIAKRLVEGLRNEDPASILAALGKDGRWIGESGIEGATVLDVGRALKQPARVPLYTDPGKALPVVGGYAFPVGTASHNALFPLTLVVAIDDANVIRAGIYDGWVKAVASDPASS